MVITKPNTINLLLLIYLIKIFIIIAKINDANVPAIIQ